ncbi:c-type cytochrome [Salipiger aestuarii]|uniref:c-type cytochrome n=1 Tax=Salipiger aestuarii TaxID=568098 RepID=UPI00025B78C6|nr:c-type cytochrome [Salipiger aestuarii]EIE52330.1 diheme cytochrome c SoxD [Citreicella sp. 357]
MSKSLELLLGTAGGIALMLVVAVNFADRNVAGFPGAPHRVAALPTSSGAMIGAVQAATAEADAPLGLGRAALPEEVAAWDLDVSPDGTGLPEGSGDVWTGEAVFEENCAVCHGSFAEGVDNWPKLAGGGGTLADQDPLKTVGSYWPYLSTVWDYVHRSMPFGNAQSLSPDDVYAIVAYILYSNDLVDDDFELSDKTLAGFEMPNAGGFVTDDRATTEYPQWRRDPCMENCKQDVRITMKATVLDVTPDQDGAPAVAEPAPKAPAVVAPSVAPAAAPAAIDAALAATGAQVFKKCKACHQVGKDAKNRTGPVLTGIVGQAVADREDFKYSKAMVEHGGIWDSASLRGFLADPKGYMKGTKMSFAGLRKPEEIDAVIEYLRSVQ